MNSYCLRLTPTFSSNTCACHARVAVLGITKRARTTPRRSA
uniref:Uncharacterized protein n=1 Tax=Nonomuraea gerenzanensis TaxID=93944 RepID=A0A1M4E4C2_9ACTN|nr:hypothetical protein BN4615_P3201 [Nonomuraea gerenzanensis]